jgi:hypothetical protein
LLRVTAEEGAEDNPVAKKVPPPAEVTWFIGMRLYRDTVIPTGEKESSAPDADYTLRIRVCDG